MPVPYQIVPKGSLFRPKIETHINDNSQVVTNIVEGGGTVTSVLCVFASPRGRDNQMITINNGLNQFLEEFGAGPFSVYGQPYLNAYNAARAASGAGAMVHCLRVTADNASYSVAALVAKYHTETVDGQEVMHVHFVVKAADEPLTNLNELAECVSVPDGVDDNGDYSLKLFTIAYRGRGIYGQNVRFRITNDAGSDKQNSYKNYAFEIYRKDTVLSLAESFSVVIPEGAVSGNTSLYMQDVINDETNGSNIVRIAVDPQSFETLFNEYLARNMSTTFTLDDFDPLLGLDKYTRAGTIPNYVIDSADTTTPLPGEVPVDINQLTGIALLGGDDGDLDVSNPNRQDVLDDLYLRAFNGELDRRIKSSFQFPTTFIFDANFAAGPDATHPNRPNVKLALAQLVEERKDCVGVLDFGLNILTTDSVQAYFEENIEGIVDSYRIVLEPYAMRMVDPYSRKSITVTSTAWMVGAYLRHISAWNGKHRPMAGNRFGVISGVIENTVYPIFDETLDADLMDELADEKCNVAKYNQNQIVVRSMQNTTQSMLSALTELNNVLVVLDIKRDCERLVANYEYDFMEATDISRFNTDLALITSKYADAQVRRISGYFDRSQWEAERSILHLYIQLVHKDLVKTVIIEIDVNRDSE